MARLSRPFEIAATVLARHQFDRPAVRGRTSTETAVVCHPHIRAASELEVTTWEEEDMERVAFQNCRRWTSIWRKRSVTFAIFTRQILART
jgi:hypothetical protein